MRKILTLSLLLVSMTLFGTFMYHQVQSYLDQKNYLGPGERITVGNLKYHIYCTGLGTPTIVMEAGLGENSLSWYGIQGELSKRTRTCTYDRAGLGWSDGIDKKYSLDEISNDLNILLNNASVPGPYVLVGHSRGGIYVRNYYKKFSNDVTGIVLVDSTHEQGVERSYEYLRESYNKQEWQMRFASVLSHLGIIRILKLADAKYRGDVLPENILISKTAVQNLTKSAIAVTNEISVMRGGIQTPLSPPSRLNDLPLIVISSGKRIPPDYRVDEIKENLTQQEKVKIIEYSLQKELANLSSHSKHIFAENSGHFIMYDEPELIIDSVESMIHEVRLLKK
ncbi:MAG: alpha/beta hydrolase [Gammaproteobacteria bacterium]|nr:alpha/beta hydrolase [Gammaproteobacteria bacterium]MDH5694050.1 alpha/beta hydrolase [Gammaproteobacteria bacterium]